MQAWEIHERLAADVHGEWAWVIRGGSYREAPERGVAWMGSGSGGMLPELLHEEASSSAALVLGGPFQRVLERGAPPSPYMVLEPVEGVSLRRVLHRGPSAPATAVRIGLTLAEAAASAHAARAEDGSATPVYGLRFGADAICLDAESVRVANPRARLCWPVDDSGPREVKWSADVDFLAPEQGLGQPASAETDVYAIALVVLALCLGRSPLEREWLLPTVSAVVRAEINPSDLDPLPPPLRAVLLQALDREPNKRPFGPEQLAGRLLEAIPDAATASLAPLTEELPRTWLPGSHP